MPPISLGKNANARREQLREELWPGSSEQIAGSQRRVGFFQASRTLPLILNLLSEKSIVGTKEGNCARVYVELLARDMGQGLVEIFDDAEHAYFSGYRRTRTWEDHIWSLQRTGFIEVKPRGNRKIGYILILDERHAVSRLRGEGKIDDLWWEAYQRRLRDVGASPVVVSEFTEFRSRRLKNPS